MDPKLLFLPAVAMAGLTCLVWIRLYVVRIGQMRRERIHPQAVATSAQASAKLTQSAAADNFRNLFELPVLFYLALTVAALSQLGDGVVLGLAWAFVALRVAHSAIHCGYNRVMHRFAVYVAGALVLWALWAYLAIALVRA
ncbi:MAPEG family protein [Lysobacter sp. CCNWLW3]|uniref:MAPEG family protein n=1 Tax=unclassified Lysobacter TaxID=2635362 RepID=UPI002FD522AC